MIIKGKARGNPGGLARHLGNAETNEVISLIETKGTAAQDLEGALYDLAEYAEGTRVKRPLYHAAISPELPHRLTDDQRFEAVDALEEKMGLTDHPRVIVLHEKDGREHIHVVWARVDPFTHETAHDDFNYRKHEEVARDLERRFGHDKIQGAFAEREGVERPDRTPSRAELRQEERTGIKGTDVKDDITALFNQSDGPEAFRAGLTENGYSLAKGDRRDYVIIDREGGIHSLARRIEGVNAAGLREFMDPLNKESVPSIEEARQLLAERQFEQKIKEKYGLTEEQIKRLERLYGGGGDYVSQSSAALDEAQMRQERLDAKSNHKVMPYEEEQNASNNDDKKNEEFEEKRRKEDNEETICGSEESSVVSKSSSLDSVEMSDEKRTTIERFMSSMDGGMSRDGGNKPGQAGGRGGRKRE